MWAGESDINSASIGIEIQNPGHEMGYPEFPEPQLAALEALSRDIIARHRSRASACSPTPTWRRPARRTRARSSPGRAWPAAGIGHWVTPEPVNPADPGIARDAAGPLVAEVQTVLAAYGYGIEATGVCDAKTEFVVTAFQRHFRPKRVDGRIDQSTITTLERLAAALPGAGACAVA